MTTHIEEKSYQVLATEDLSGAKYKMITLGGTVAQAANYKQSAGICKTAPGSGYNTQAVYEGLTKAYVGAAVTTLGYPLKVANSGFLVVANSGDSVVGRALTAAASGDIIPVAIDLKTVGFFGG